MLISTCCHLHNAYSVISMTRPSTPCICTGSLVLKALSIQGQVANQPGPKRMGEYLDHNAVPVCQVWLNEHPEYVVEEAQRQQDTGNLHSISRTWSEMLSRGTNLGQLVLSNAQQKVTAKRDSVSRRHMLARQGTNAQTGCQTSFNSCCKSHS